jgi:hypothetical protein
MFAAAQVDNLSKIGAEMGAMVDGGEHLDGREESRRRNEQEGRK